MFVSQDLIFLELQKTGGSHILRLLGKLVNGEITGKHNRLSQDNMGNRFVFGSIRNPWDWYVSLWAYGVGGKGAIRHRTVTKFDLNYYHSGLPFDMGKNWLSLGQFLAVSWHDLLKPTRLWEQTYQDADNAAQFRSWLKMLLNHERRFDIGEGYAFSPISNHAGLMTYRYFRLFTLGNNIFTDPRVAEQSSLHRFYDEYNIAKGMVRTENLEEDFIHVMNAAGHKLTDEQIVDIQSQKKTNTSRRNQADYYYDEETIALVANKEKFLIEKFSYSPPALAPAS